ncbi:related to Cutinase gene palindrome-binding protein [Cephalotrichum gorgonifer]|uniref:Related to Cutinase gene palindrome-binding protein n=1 Tax=Cephalotrichum gorgonifer TaxID=2041049 RepID=A0AAE8MWE9_9PEZI|nr:related to Cutinase gene palindrome-binding protein [Cephalotrichum gorgonifer]
MRFFYRLKRKDGTYAVREAVGHAHTGAPQFSPDPSNQAPFCQAIFLTSRPYPTKNAGLLDTFPEHKIENERLKRRIAALRREEEAEELEAQRQWMLRRDSLSDDPRMRDSSSTTVDGRMPPPDRPVVDSELTRENLEGLAAGSQPDLLRDKMARYELGSHANTADTLTGLGYKAWARGRAAGASTSSRSTPRQITGDAGIAIPLGRDTRQGEKKKQKVAEENICTDCGTLESPEWRKGPQGPKTLCNACGLRWAKRERKTLASEGSCTAPADSGEQGRGGAKRARSTLC